jgi:hypothetical protein
MTAAVIPIAKPESDSRDAVANLVAERSRVIAELQRLAAIDGPVREAGSAVAAIDRAIATLDADERSRSEAWAASGTGAPPEPRNTERAGLVRRRLELESDVAAAQNRANAIAPRRVELNGEIRRIEHLIFAAKLRGALGEARRLNARAHEIAAEAREPIARVVALKLALIGHRDSEDQATQRLIGETIDALTRFEMPEIGGDPASLQGFVNEWEQVLR